MTTPTEKHLVNQMTNTAPKRSPPAETMSVGGDCSYSFNVSTKSVADLCIFLNEFDRSIILQRLLSEVPDTLRS